MPVVDQQNNNSKIEYAGTLNGKEKSQVQNIRKSRNEAGLEKRDFDLADNPTSAG